MKLAALDIGTNTALMLIVVADGPVVHVLRDEHAIARLGEGVDKTHRIGEPGLERLIAILKSYRATLQELGVEHISAVATSAMREAENRDEVIERIKLETGFAIELLSGSDEALWTYRGALLGLSSDSASVAVVDIGGGSTEISIGDGRDPSRGVSIDVGAVRITERCFMTSPITREAAEDARRTIQSALREGFREPVGCKELVAVAGTPTTLAAMHQGLKTFDVSEIHGYTLNREAIEQLLDIMLSVTTPMLLDHFPVINKNRADILPAGTLILVEAMDLLGAERITVSTQGLRYGIALRELEKAFGILEFSLG